MKKVLVAAVLALVLIIGGGTALAWYASVEGRPAGSGHGCFIWHDGGGFHVRAVSHGHSVVYSGVIRTDGHFVDVHQRHLESGDHLRLDSDRNTLRFRFTTGGGMEGVDFRVNGNRVSFELYVNGNPARPGEIHIGAEGWHPGDYRFSLRR